MPNKSQRFKRGKSTGRPRVRTTVPRFTGGIPNRTYTQLRYVAVGALNTPSAVGSFNVNMWQTSLHDPDYSGVGHQPMYYDQYAALYYNYRIHGFRYKIEVTNSGSHGAQLFVSHKPDLALPTSSSIETEMERSYCMKRLILPSASGMNHRILSGYIDTAKTWGLSKPEFIANDGFLSYFTGSPARVAALHFGYGMSGASTTTLEVNITLDFDVECWRRLDIVGS
jgi:hypothetical protein